MQSQILILNADLRTRTDNALANPPVDCGPTLAASIIIYAAIAASGDRDKGKMVTNADHAHISLMDNASAVLFFASGKEKAEVVNQGRGRRREPATLLWLGTPCPRVGPKSRCSTLTQRRSRSQCYDKAQR